MITKQEQAHIFQNVSKICDEQGYDIFCPNHTERQIIFYQEFEPLVRYTYILKNGDNPQLFDLNIMEYGPSIFSSFGGESSSRREIAQKFSGFSMDALIQFLSEKLYQAETIIPNAESSRMVMMRRLDKYMVTKDMIHPDDWETYPES